MGGVADQLASNAEKLDPGPASVPNAMASNVKMSSLASTGAADELALNVEISEPRPGSVAGNLVSTVNRSGLASTEAADEMALIVKISEPGPRSVAGKLRSTVNTSGLGRLPRPTGATNAILWPWLRMSTNSGWARTAPNPRRLRASDPPPAAVPRGRNLTCRRLVQDAVWSFRTRWPALDRTRQPINALYQSTHPILRFVLGTPGLLPAGGDRRLGDPRPRRRGAGARVVAFALRLPPCAGRPPSATVAAPPSRSRPPHGGASRPPPVRRSAIPDHGRHRGHSASMPPPVREVLVSWCYPSGSRCASERDWGSRHRYNPRIEAKTTCKTGRTGEKSWDSLRDHQRRLTELMSDEVVWSNRMCPGPNPVSIVKPEPLSRLGV